MQKDEPRPVDPRDPREFIPERDFIPGIIMKPDELPMPAKEEKKEALPFLNMKNPFAEKPMTTLEQGVQEEKKKEALPFLNMKNPFAEKKMTTLSKEGVQKKQKTGPVLNMEKKIVAKNISALLNKNKTNKQKVVLRKVGNFVTRTHNH